MARKRIEVDTRRLSNTRDGGYDGFVHTVPRALASIHIIDINCWCEPMVYWPENGTGTLVVVHKNKRRADDGTWREEPE